MTDEELRQLNLESEEIAEILSELKNTVRTLARDWQSPGAEAFWERMEREIKRVSALYEKAENACAGLRKELNE